MVVTAPVATSIFLTPTAVAMNANASSGLKAKEVTGVLNLATVPTPSTSLDAADPVTPASVVTVRPLMTTFLTLYASNTSMKTLVGDRPSTPDPMLLNPDTIVVGAVAGVAMVYDSK